MEFNEDFGRINIADPMNNQRDVNFVNVIYFVRGKDYSRSLVPLGKSAAGSNKKNVKLLHNIVQND